MEEGTADVEFGRYQQSDEWRLRIHDAETRRVIAELTFDNVGAADLLSNHTVRAEAKWYYRPAEGDD